MCPTKEHKMQRRRGRTNEKYDAADAWGCQACGKDGNFNQYRWTCECCDDYHAWIAASKRDQLKMGEFLGAAHQETVKWKGGARQNGAVGVRACEGGAREGECERGRSVFERTRRP